LPLKRVAAVYVSIFGMLACNAPGTIV